MDAHKSLAGDAIDCALRELIPGFLENRRRDLAALRAAAAACDYELLERIGHGLKGVGGIYGYPEIGACGARVEAAAQRRDPEGIRDALDALQACLARADSAPA